MTRRILLPLALVALVLAGCDDNSSTTPTTSSHTPGMTHAPGMTHDMNGTAMPTLQATQPGQAGFAAVQEIVAQLQQSPSTDWSRVNITALREHLVDMDALFTGATVHQQDTPEGFVATLTGDARVLAAAQRMVPEHVASLTGHPWVINATFTDNGMVMRANATMAPGALELQALGFFGVMATDSHHQEHHVMVATGQAMH